MEPLKRSQDAQELWRTLLPDIPIPENRQFIVWAKRFDDSQIERAFWRTGQKFSSQKIDPEIIHRYATGLLLNLERDDSQAQPATATV